MPSDALPTAVATVRVPLCGTRGRDREMLIDAADWQDVSARFGPHWVIPANTGEYAICAGTAAGTVQEPRIELARYLAGQADSLIYRNRNILDVTRANLETVPLAAYLRRGRPYGKLPMRPGSLKPRPVALEAPKALTLLEIAEEAATAILTQTGRLEALERSPEVPATLPTLKLPKAGPVFANSTSTAGPTLLRDGGLAVEVSLCGSLGTGKRMLLDVTDWSRIRLAFGEHWGLREDAAGHRYVISLGGPGAALRGFTLARWIIGARPGQVATYRNKDSLDLRASNLAAVDRRAFVADVFGHGEALAA